MARRLSDKELLAASEIKRAKLFEENKQLSSQVSSQQKTIVALSKHIESLQSIISGYQEMMQKVYDGINAISEGIVELERVQSKKANRIALKNLAVGGIIGIFIFCIVILIIAGV